jgi:hypothetical protein
MSIPCVRRFCPLASYMILAAGCATGGASNASQCRSDLQASASTLREAIDSATAQERLDSMWPPGAGLTVARLGGEPDPDSDAIRIWSRSLTDAQADALENVLASTAVMPLWTSERAYLFIGDENGPALRRVDRLAQCAPRLLGRTRLTRRLEEEARGLRLDRRVVVRLMVFVETSGRSGVVRIDEGSGDFAIDQAAARVFDGVDFTPAQVEGIPVGVWASFPVTLTPR